MSIYATLWNLRFPKDGDYITSCDWIEVTAQSVPPHIASPSPGAGYETGDPFASFLPPAVPVDPDGEAPFMRAVVFVTEFTPKGTSRSPQEYASPLLVINGQDYAQITFTELYNRLCTAHRGNRAPIALEIMNPDGSTKIVRSRHEGK